MRRGCGRMQQQTTRPRLLFVSPLVLGLPEQLAVLVLAHLLLSPLDDTTHRLTSFFNVTRNLSGTRNE